MFNRKVSVICIDCDPNEIDKKLMKQTYNNLEVVEAKTGRDFFGDIVDYIYGTDSAYICFLEKYAYYLPNKIEDMVRELEQTNVVDVLLCGRNYINKEKEIVSHGDMLSARALQGRVLHGEQMIQLCLKTGNNWLGSLSSIMLKRESFNIDLEMLEKYQVVDSDMQKMLLFFHLLLGESLKFTMNQLVEVDVEVYNETLLERKNDFFKEVVSDFLEYTDITLDKEPKGISEENYRQCKQSKLFYKDIKKEITLFYQDKGEYYNLLPIKSEAEKRGYLVKESEDLNEQAEIGIYCQHFGKPENSKFSLVLLHDMAQGHNRWPNLWELERWNRYDIGILPGNKWAERWKKCALNYYAIPKFGAYVFGYPKSDFVKKKEIVARREELEKNFNFQYDVTVLYAPSWENDEKEDDFVRALASLQVNLVIKQAHWSEEYGAIIQNIQNMRKMHEGKYNNVYYIEPQENILVAMDMCDVVVSDESSVMTEALMYGKPSIAITDWLIPDTVPSRFASTPFDFVCKCKKVELREKIEKFIDDRESIGLNIKMDDYFCNIGNVNSTIMDAIEYFIGNSMNKEFKEWRLESEYMPIALWK